MLPNKILLGLVLLIGANLLYLDYVLLSPSQPGSIPEATSPLETEVEYIDRCGPDCQAYVDTQIGTLAAKLNIKMPTPQPTQRATTVVVPTGGQFVTYVPIPGTGNSTANDWATLPGTDFYFNTGDYSGLKQVQFEATIRLLNGNGTVYVRLYDATHGIAVQGSEATATSQTSTAVVASPLNFWSGRNLIQVQVKSLTADTAIYDGGRLKVITQ